MNKKIVFITSSFPFGKSEVWAINELNSFLELGNEITIIPRTGKGKIINQDAVKFNSNLIDLSFFDWNIFIFLLKTIFFKPILFLKLLKENVKHSNTIIDFIKGLIILPKSIFIAEILKSKKIDHIHSLQTTSTAFLAFILSYILKVPWSYTLHTSEILNSRYKRSILSQSRSASICRTISQRTANELSNFIGPSLSKKVVKVHLGVDVKVSRKATGFVNNSFTIVTPAELTTRKGHIYSIEVSKKLVDMGITNFEWFFYGSGPLLNELQEKVKELNLINHCYFPGNIDHHQLLSRYKNNNVDIVIISSISTDVPEGIPVSLMEAMSFKIPVIATDCGATRELVDGKSGILVNEKDPEAVTNAIIEFINKPEFKRKIGNNGKDKVMQDFDTLKTSSDLNKLF
tara:strand:- start:6894 stop:8099 length:1206 start_codon:yes stop_codon:yes gene_type:complete